MGTSDFGTQSIAIDYNEEGKSRKVNVINYQLMEKGIYEGGLLSKSATNKATVSPLTCFAIDDDNGIGVRVSTSGSVELTVSPTDSYIVLRMIWVDTPNNYMDFLAVEHNSDPTNHTDTGKFWDSDIIVGQCSYISGTLQTDFDYSNRSVPGLLFATENRVAFNVTQQVPTASNQVDVAAGNAIINKKHVVYAGGTSPTFSSTTDGRIDLLYLTPAGSLAVLEGVDAASPVEPEWPTEGMVLAKITRGSARSTIVGTEITRIQPERESTTGIEGDFKVTGDIDADGEINSTGGFNGNLTGNVTGNLTGNADTATILQTIRNISLSGDVSGSIPFNGSSDVIIVSTVADNSHNHLSVNISDATENNTPNTIVKRNANGGFSAQFVNAISLGSFFGDLAEKYKCKEVLPEGTVLKISSEDKYDVERSDKDLCVNVIGVVSANPGFLLNSKESGVKSGRIGKLSIRVVGKVKKGDVLVPTKNGCARKLKRKSEYKYKIGFALETSHIKKEKLIKCII